MNFPIISSMSSTPTPTQPVPIEPGGNISGLGTGSSAINVASNLGTTLLPAFQGGTLTIDQTNSSITQNFTLDGSTTNAVDASGKEASFVLECSDVTPPAAHQTD